MHSFMYESMCGRVYFSNLSVTTKQVTHSSLTLSSLRGDSYVLSFESGWFLTPEEAILCDLQCEITKCNTASAWVLSVFLLLELSHHAVGKPKE